MRWKKFCRAGALAIFLSVLLINAADHKNQFIAVEQPEHTLQQTGKTSNVTAGVLAFPEEENMPEQVTMGESLYAGVTADIHMNGFAEVVANKDQFVTTTAIAVNPEQQVYSFLQGPKSWGESRDWSGAWSGEYVNGNYFGNFGCGLCCMANIYSSLTGYECSPWDMFEHAREVSGYSPTRKVGAIGWADMKVTLRKSGFDCSLERKPETYEAFQRKIASAKTAVVLVSSRDDDTYWKNTGGHYVNVWLYNEETDEVFLTDPGVPEHNRQWIPLRSVYDALKTVSQYQYLLVSDYAEENNFWKQDGIKDAWVRPATVPQ